jgi:predicted metal-dependent peptidase
MVNKGDLNMKKSRKINTYVKPKVVKEEIKFPYKRVRIDWIDILLKAAGVLSTEFKNMKLATPVSEGWLFSKDKETVKIFAGYDVDEDGITFSERSVFPTSCVKKLTYLD